MAIVLAYRTDQSSYDARWAAGHKAGVEIDPSSNTGFLADAGAIGGVALDFNNSANQSRINWSAYNNTPNSQAISITIRLAPQYTGTPASRRCFFELGNVALRPSISLWHHTTGNIVVYIVNGAGVVCANIVSLGAFSPTSGTWYDITFTWPGTTAANGIKCYVDNVLNGQATAAAAIDSAMTNKFMSSLCIGGGTNATIGVIRVNEVVIQDAVIDPTINQNLESGLGLLNGASRTSFMSDVAGSVLTSYDGLAGGGSHAASQYCWSN